ncbi:MAG: nitroreductase [Oscillospiraceae bacterium]|nr:nitroreductase [Oscillospiraceae bacterium]
MNEALKNLMDRRSIKKYKSDMVPMEIIDQICEAGKYAACGRGAQAGLIIAVTDKAVRDKLSAMNAAVMGTDTDPFYGAPVVLVVLANKEVPTYLYDGSLVIGNLMTAANALGIGSCWIHRAKQMFESEEGKQILADLGIEGQWEGIGNCVIGYADEEKTAKPRKENWVYKI